MWFTLLLTPSSRSMDRGDGGRGLGEAAALSLFTFYFFILVLFHNRRPSPSLFPIVVSYTSPYFLGFSTVHAIIGTLILNYLVEKLWCTVHCKMYFHYLNWEITPIKPVFMFVCSSGQCSWEWLFLHMDLEMDRWFHEVESIEIWWHVLYSFFSQWNLGTRCGADE